MQKLTLGLATLCIAFCCLFAPTLLFAQGDPLFFVQFFSMKMQEDVPEIEFSLLPNQPELLEKHLHSGAVLNLNANFLIEEKRALFPNRAVHSSGHIWQFRFDPLAREYIVIQQGSAMTRQRDFKSLLEQVLGDATFRLPPTTPLRSDASYVLTMSFSLRYAEVPPWLQRTLFFWSWDVGEPLVFSHEFVYKAL